MNHRKKNKYPLHGWIGLCLITIFWTMNWSLDCPHTHWAFFPLWLGYCLTIDGLVLFRTNTSLLTRSWRKYAGLFIISAPVWWLFEIFNWRLQNWRYLGVENLTPMQYGFWTTLSFTTVIPAVFGSAELVASLDIIEKLKRGFILRPDKPTTICFFICGMIMLFLMLVWPRLFFPFLWLSLFFLLEPVNVWLGNRSFAEWTQKGDWRPVISLWLGVLLTAFFWEMWNYYSFPKWIYHVPWGGWYKVFEMPLLGYGGYLPFSLELFAFYHLFSSFGNQKETRYMHLGAEE